MSGVPIIARASSERVGRRAWTELKLSYVEGGVLAEIIGETRVAGQERRRRAREFDTVAQALKWNAFDRDSALYGELRDKALAYLENSNV